MKEQGYTFTVNVPVYEAKGECPNVLDLVDMSKADKLLHLIENSDVVGFEREFLLRACYRFDRFHFERIAEFYCHATPEVQELMEELALVIIDFDQAIEKGYVKQTKGLRDLLERGLGSE